ncbi:hypothetical protein [Pseudomonas syringae]|nr:hypothetical protein [Pseudomonas syringae]
MNPIAQAALNRARQPAPACLAVAKKPEKSATKAPLYATPAPIHATPPAIYAPPPPRPKHTGPIDRYQVMQGRASARDFVRSCPAQLLTAWGIADLVQRMEQSLHNKPASFALGFSEVLEQLREHLANMPATPPPL